jgi:aspartate kinase
LADLDVNVSVDTGYAKVAIVGTGMRGVPGVMARMMRGLQQAGIAVYHSTDSHINIACLVKQSEMGKTMQALHESFELGN